MAGKKKKVGHARPGQQRTPADACSKVQAAADQQGGHSTHSSTVVSRATGNTAHTAGTSHEGGFDVLTELQINDQGVARAAVNSQFKGWQGRAMQPRVLKAASATGSVHDAVAQAPALDAHKLVAQLHSSSNVSVQAGLLQHITTMATSGQEHRSALLAAGVIPALLRLEQSSSKPIQAMALSAVLQLLRQVAAKRETAFATRIIPHVVPLVRHGSKDIQLMALTLLTEMSYNNETQAQLIVAAGAIPAMTEALHIGHEHTRMTAASLLVQLATVGGMGTETALAGAVPVAVSVVQCSPPEYQLEAVWLLEWWASQFGNVNNMAVKLDTIAALVPLLSSHDIQTQQATAALLTKLVGLGGGTQAAIKDGAVPALVQLLHSTNQHVCLFAADALQCILMQCSQAASIAAAAGAIKPLVSMLASSTRGKQCLADRDVSMGATIPPCRYQVWAPVFKETWQEAALRSLCCIAAAGDQHCTAMVAAGAVPAITATQTPEGTVQPLAPQTLKHLVAHATSRTAVATHLAGMLHNSKFFTDNVCVKLAVTDLVMEDGFRSAFLTAGGAAALVSLLGTDTDPAVCRWATGILGGLVCGPVEAAAVVKAGAIPPLVQLLQNSSDADTRTTSAHVLWATAKHTSIHGHMAEVIPQLLHVMRGSDARLHTLVGCLLQVLALGQSASVLQVFRDTKHQWDPLLASSCSEAQRYAAGAVYYYMLGNDRQRCSEGIKTLFLSVRWIHPGQYPSQWKPLLSVEACMELYGW